MKKRFVFQSFGLVVLAAVISLRAEEPPSAGAPPPPVYNVESEPETQGQSPAGAGSSAAVDAPAAPDFGESASETPAAAATPDPDEGKGDLPQYDPSTEGSEEAAAPQRSDEAMIRDKLEIAYQLYHAEDYAAASQSTGQILDQYKKRRLYWINYLDALCKEHLGQYSDAIAQYEKVRVQAPHTTYSNAATFRIGICQTRLKNRSDAIFTFRDVIETNPRSEYRLQAYVHLGNLYRDAHDWNHAERIYKDLMRIYPNTMWAYTSMQYLAECYSYSGHPGQAVTAYQAMQRNPDVPVVFKAQAQLRIGEIHYKQKHWQEAIVAFRLALRDYAEVPGIALAAEEKIKAASAARSEKTSYKQARNMSRKITQAPEDESYRLKQEREETPY